MFLYLFLVASLTTSSFVKTSSFAEATKSTPADETADTSKNIDTKIAAIDPELQEIITLFTDKENLDATVATSTSTTDRAAPPEEQNPITITNAIEPSMLAYKHWTGTYSPEKFTITVNNIEVALGGQHTVPTTKDPVTIRYDYSFMNGMRTGTKTVSYQLNENITQANITFSWKNDWKVLVDNGTAIKQEEISS